MRFLFFFYLPKFSHTLVSTTEAIAVDRSVMILAARIGSETTGATTSSQNSTIIITIMVTTIATTTTITINNMAYTFVGPSNRTLILALSLVSVVVALR